MTDEIKKPSKDEILALLKAHCPSGT